MRTIVIHKFAGTFAENKDVARKLRIDRIMPSLADEQRVIIDFAEVTGATQSFVHALISDSLRHYGDHALDLITFKNCNPVVQEIVTTVAEYMQES